MPAVSSKLYDLLGGAVAVNTATLRLYEKVIADPALAPFFKGLDMEAQAKKFVGFMTMAMGGPHEYKGADLRRAHERLVRNGMGDGHFDRIVDHLEQTMLEMGMDPDLVQQALELVASTRADVLCLTLD